MAKVKIRLKRGQKRPKDSAKKKALRESWDKLLAKYAPNPNIVVPKKLTISLRYSYRGQDQEIKRPALLPPEQPKARLRYEGTMAEREQRAQEEIERKKKRVAITVNKGAYQYITEGMDPKTFGRK